MAHLTLALDLGRAHQAHLARTGHQRDPRLPRVGAQLEAGDRALAVLLTGMGTDGAEGLLRIKEAGGWTIAQDQDTSVVWGMPGEAVRLGSERSSS